jgi:uncharacterized protein YcfL
MKIVSLAAALTALLIAGCATNEQLPQELPMPAPAPVELVDTSVPNLKISYADENVARSVKVLNARVVKKGQFPRVAFEIVNFTQVKFPIEYKVQWCEADGTPLQSSAPWLQTTLSGTEAKPVGSMGKSVDAVFANVTIRFPTNVQIFVPTPDPVEQMRIEQQVVNDYNARLSSGQIRY